MQTKADWISSGSSSRNCALKLRLTLNTQRYSEATWTPKQQDNSHLSQGQNEAVMPLDENNLFSLEKRSSEKHA